MSKTQKPKSFHNSPRKHAMTPAAWRHVNIMAKGSAYRLSVGLFDSVVGKLGCQAAKIKSDRGLSAAEALRDGLKLEAWLRVQEDEPLLK